MNDTPLQIEEMQFEMMINLSTAKRIEMASEMFMTARHLAVESIPEHVRGEQRRTAYLKKMYGDALIDSIMADHE